MKTKKKTKELTAAEFWKREGYGVEAVAEFIHNWDRYRLHPSFPTVIDAEMTAAMQAHHQGKKLAMDQAREWLMDEEESEQDKH